MIEVVTFDLDNTLWQTDDVIRRAEAAMRSWLSERVPAFPTLFDGATLWALREGVAKDQPDIVHDVTRLRLEVLRRALTQCGLDAERANRYAARAFEAFAEVRHQVAYYDGALQTLDTLARRYVLGALTNGNADYARLGLDRYFAFGFTAADVGASKPHPAMFRAALKHTGVVPGAAVHVGDHPEHDVRGAQNAGMRAVWANYEGLTDEVGADAVVGALAELPEAITALSRTPLKPSARR